MNDAVKKLIEDSANVNTLDLVTAKKTWDRMRKEYPSAIDTFATFIDFIPSAKRNNKKDVEAVMYETAIVLIALLNNLENQISIGDNSVSKQRHCMLMMLTLYGNIVGIQHTDEITEIVRLGKEEVDDRGVPAEEFELLLRSQGLQHKIEKPSQFVDLFSQVGTGAVKQGESLSMQDAIKHVENLTHELIKKRGM